MIISCKRVDGFITTEGYGVPVSNQERADLTAGCYDQEKER